jgi:hypothetical protein
LVRQINVKKIDNIRRSGDSIMIHDIASIRGMLRQPFAAAAERVTTITAITGVAVIMMTAAKRE